MKTLADKADHCHRVHTYRLGPDCGHSISTPLEIIHDRTQRHAEINLVQAVHLGHDTSERELINRGVAPANMPVHLQHLENPGTWIVQDDVSGSDDRTAYTTSLH